MPDDDSEFGTEQPEVRASKAKAEQGVSILPPDADEDDKPMTRRVQWGAHSFGEWVGVGSTQPKLKAGVYRIQSVRNDYVFAVQCVNVDSLMEFPDSKTDTLLKEIEEFWNRGKIFKEYGYLHRRGLLLYGPAGGGKTSLVQQVIKKIIDRGGIVFLCGHPSILGGGLKVFREIEPDRPVVCVFEDIDAIVRDYGEPELLSILDGEVQIDKVLNLATTNYPELLDRRLVARPRRFDRVIKIGMPEQGVRLAYFLHKLKIKEDEVEKWVKATDGFSFAAMAELVISVKCLGGDFDKSVEVIGRLLKAKASSRDYDSEKVGFNASA